MFKKLLGECEPNWTALRKGVEDEEERVAGTWGEFNIPSTTIVKDRKEDVIRKHDEQKQGLSLADKGAASTTKKIV